MKYKKNSYKRLQLYKRKKMKNRIRQIMEDQHLTQQSFANLIGIATATLSSIFNDRTKPSLNIVDAIKKKFPNINLEWLLYGTLPMYIDMEEKKENASSLLDASHPTVEEESMDFPRASQPQSPSLFEQPQMLGANRMPKSVPQSDIKIIDKIQRKITEIRIFYDDQTWETFVPKK